jgi:hypothetical protein
VSLRCPKCGREFDVTLFQYRRTVVCPCGEPLSLDEGHTMRGEHCGAGGAGAAIDWESLEREIFSAAEGGERSEDRQRAEAFRREADRIVSLILFSDMPRVDIEIAIRAFRERVLGVFPEKEDLFAALYLSRFRRLWSQFRNDEEQLLPEET